MRVSGETNYPRTVAVDFDGVLCEYDEVWRGPDHFGEPTSWGRPLLDRLRELGYQRIVLFTCRVIPKWNDGRPAEQLRAAVQRWLDDHGMAVDEITGEKPLAQLYIDDRAGLPQVRNHLTWILSRGEPFTVEQEGA